MLAYPILFDESPYINSEIMSQKYVPKTLFKCLLSVIQPVGATDQTVF